MTEPIRPKLPKKLRALIEIVHSERGRSQRERFKQHRVTVITSLRERGYTEREIAEMIGVTVQYLHKDYPQQKPEAEQKPEGT